MVFIAATDSKMKHILMYSSLLDKGKGTIIYIALVTFLAAVKNKTKHMIKAT